jgi:hypothetical protein
MRSFGFDPYAFIDMSLTDDEDIACTVNVGTHYRFVIYSSDIIGLSKLIKKTDCNMTQWK